LAKDEKRIADLENSASGDDTDNKVEKLTTQVTALETKLKDLNTQVSQLRANPSKECGCTTSSTGAKGNRPAGTVPAPFKVVNRAGKPIFTVEEDGGVGSMSVMGVTAPIFTVREVGGAGEVTVLDGVGNPMARTGVVDGSPRFSIIASGAVVIALGAVNGDGAFNTFQNGETTASLRTLDGHGQLVIMDGTGKPAVVATISRDGLGEVVVEKNDKPEAFMKVAADGTGGATCVDRQGTLRCLGINLPLQR
jgi:hypothetical protein